MSETPKFVEKFNATFRDRLHAVIDELNLDVDRDPFTKLLANCIASKEYADEVKRELTAEREKSACIEMDRDHARLDAKTERERAERLMERLQQESERCDKEVSQRIWADTELQRERERADRNQEDAERYQWLRMNRLWLKANLPMIHAGAFDAAIDAARRK